ncbi:glutathione peroxidase [Bacillus sp. AK128]
MSVYDYNALNIMGKEVKLSDYKNRVLLIVNTASKCALTPQFKKLQELYNDYKNTGLIVLGFPCTQFRNQELGNNDDIEEFCQVNYGVTFPMFGKVDVKGEDAHPLFQYLTKAKKGFLGSEAIKWNFTKFLINKNGEVVKRYAPTTNPATIRKDIEELL